MDPGFYGDLAGRLYGLLIGLEDRLDCDDAAIIRQFTGARHYGLGGLVFLGMLVLGVAC